MTHSPMLRQSMDQQGLIFQQLFEEESSSYTYILADPATKDAVIIDPVIETVDRDLGVIRELGLKLKYILETHIHADHVTGSAVLKQETGAKAAVSKDSNIECADFQLQDGQILEVGSLKIKVISTPGHTASCMSYLLGDRVFTGDALLIRATGRTDFQGGSSAKLFESITKKLFTLPPQTKVYPAHDYKGQKFTTIGEEIKENPRIKAGTSKEQFMKTMAELKLAPPAKIGEALSANMACGKKYERQS